MKIRFTEYAPDPSLRGTTKTLPAHRAQPLIDSGVAVQIPYASAHERLAAEATSQTVGSIQNVMVTGVQWGFLPPGNPQFHVPAIERRSGSETVWYSTPPPDCPTSILKQFLEATQPDFNSEAFLEKAKREQAEYDANIKHAKRW